MKPFLKGVLVDNSGQATVEAALALPLIMVLLLLLLQPAIVLYDRMVMRAAAVEGCRVLATMPVEQQSRCREYVLRRLGAVPPQSLFHEHGATCSWDVAMEGGEQASTAAVTITNKIKPLPLIGAAAYAAGVLDDQGYFTISVREECEVQPAWAAEGLGAEAPSGWIGAWTHE